MLCDPVAGQMTADAVAIDLVTLLVLNGSAKRHLIIFLLFFSFPTSRITCVVKHTELCCPEMLL